MHLGMLIFYDEIRTRADSRETFGPPKEFEWGWHTGKFDYFDKIDWLVGYADEEIRIHKQYEYTCILELGVFTVAGISNRCHNSHIKRQRPECPISTELISPIEETMILSCETFPTPMVWRETFVRRENFGPEIVPSRGSFDPPNNGPESCNDQGPNTGPPSPGQNEHPNSCPPPWSAFFWLNNGTRSENWATPGDRNFSRGFLPEIDGEVAHWGGELAMGIVIYGRTASRERLMYFPFS